MSSLTDFGPRGPGGLVVTGLRRSYGGSRVLEDISMSVNSGSLVSVVGSNGSGKTTLLRTLAGSLEPSAGAVTVAGSHPGRGLASYVPAGDRMLNWRLTVRQNLAFFARLAGFGSWEREARINAATDALGAVDLLSKPVGECSTGQRRRVMLAAGFVTGAPVALLDEPYADLDDDARCVVDEVCRRWVRAGGVVLYATPSVGDGPPADCTYHLVDGRIAESAD